MSAVRRTRVLFDEAHGEAWTIRPEVARAMQLQAPDGALRGDPAQARLHVSAMIEAISELSRGFAHQRDYLEAVVADLRAWEGSGFARPDFTHALQLFRPERRREDGIEHLVVFPMYEQNGSRDTCFEALIVRVPWPEWVAELERTRYDNPKFVPVELVDGTRGYDSECAVLFPETVSVAGRPVNHFGAIFCDREAERLRRVAGAAADLLQLNVPPDAAALLRHPGRLQEAYILWDLIHDRAHSHGDLPFDPFMIRQRAPYWMYALEELRCDLTAFTQARDLERDGVSVARHVQYAILLDRLLRFPITGPRVRNYDGLGGQLLFAHLHRHGFLHWTDNQLTIEWERVGDGVAALHAEIRDLYRRGIDRTKLQHWTAAHDLLAADVPPAIGSRWTAGTRDFTDVEDPRGYVDLVLGDEFPLSLFYTSLKAKLAASPPTAPAGSPPTTPPPSIPPCSRRSHGPTLVTPSATATIRTPPGSWTGSRRRSVRTRAPSSSSTARLPTSWRSGRCAVHGTRRSAPTPRTSTSTRAAPGRRSPG